jgi:hypothetical protein
MYPPAEVSCLAAGAGDYLAKPFSLAELLARVQAHLRVLARSRTVTTLEAGRIKLDVVRREADSGSGPARPRPSWSCGTLSPEVRPMFPLTFATNAASGAEL